MSLSGHRWKKPDWRERKKAEVEAEARAKLFSSGGANTLWVSFHAPNSVKTTLGE